MPQSPVTATDIQILLLINGFNKDYYFRTLSLNYETIKHTKEVASLPVPDEL